MTETGFVPKARYMMRALELAAQAAAMGEVPVGAVVVQKSTGRIIGEGYNRREADRLFWLLRSRRCSSLLLSESN